MSSTFPEEKIPTTKEIIKTQQASRNPNNLKNDRYQQLLGDYFKCTTSYLNDLGIPQILEQQLNRRDLDTVCAYELYQMKKEFTQSNVLDLSQFVAKH